MDDNPLWILGFLSLFHIIGGIALGNAVRNIWRAIRNQGENTSWGGSIFFVVWGSMFGCMPFVFGLDPALPNWFLPAQLLIWGTPFILSAVFGRAILDWASPLFNVGTGLMAFGGIFMFAGLLAGYFTFSDGELFQAMLLGGIFGVIGLGIFILGLANLFKNTR